MLYGNIKVNIMSDLLDNQYTYKLIHYVYDAIAFYKNFKPV